MRKACKRILSMAMVILMLLSMAACGQEESPSEPVAKRARAASVTSKTWQTMDEEFADEVPAEEVEEEAPVTDDRGTSYILNKSTKKFHEPTCGSVKQMKESNKEYYTGDRQQVIDQGYVPCKKCDP